ncbi:MAG: type IV secretion system protein [Novosphingobium sp.]
MIIACPAFDPLGPYVSSVVAYVECQGLTIGESGYRALGPGSAFGLALTGLLTIYVALIGYRLLMGSAVTLRESLVTALRLGFVLALATQWSAYRVLVFDVVTKVPEEAAFGLAGGAGIASNGSSGVAARVDLANGAIAELIKPAAAAPNPNAVTPPPVQPTPQAPKPPSTGTPALDWSVGILSVTALAGLLSVRIIMALLLAMGPGFIAAMLFDTTRSIFVGWLRVLAGTFLAAIAVPVVLDLELAVVEPQVIALRDLAGSNQPFGALPMQLLASAAFFALVLVAVLAALARAGYAFRLPENLFASLLQGRPAEPQLLLTAPQMAIAVPAGAADGEPTRAQRLAGAAQVFDWREARMADSAPEPSRSAIPHDGSAMNDYDTGRGAPPMPLGQEGRRSERRQSLAGTRRDGLT